MRTCVSLRACRNSRMFNGKQVLESRVKYHSHPLLPGVSQKKYQNCEIRGGGTRRVVIEWPDTGSRTGFTAGQPHTRGEYNAEAE